MQHILLLIQLLLSATAPWTHFARYPIVVANLSSSRTVILDIVGQGRAKSDFPNPHGVNVDRYICAITLERAVKSYDSLDRVLSAGWRVMRNLRHGGVRPESTSGTTVGLSIIALALRVY